MAIPTGRLQGIAMRRHVGCNVKCQRAGMFRKACSSECEKLRNERELETSASPFSPPTIVDDLNYRSPFGAPFGGSGPSGDAAPFNGGGGGSGGAGASGDWGSSDAGSCSGDSGGSSSGGGE